MQITNPFKLKVCMSIRMNRKRSMGFVRQRLLSPIKAFIPTHEGSFRYMISTADKSYRTTATVELYCMETGFQCVRQISLGMCYTIHGDCMSFRYEGFW